ncbi:hypothetical protein BU24DRAFT_481741 [Aaosphaeria arxii CBS 175.79]|uniref:Inhibitor I9 domain-containing protein n=1 Tax=Aaosphaeria arxii CBS 175.79 TaxID=1450172 RepID=A0A6A5XME4_9PLEO|nr:uncharacterized protein BU24DRAFT_481741 [Aaosphaeria arxii CBS 175.79]KAF2014312.1 hypothetical protein BU24DRAFT_481741 [Aaosphaeria arxii CBS 175.79]
MHLTIPLLTLLLPTLTLSLPTSSSSLALLTTLRTATLQADECKLPRPGLSCAEVPTKDIIVTYGGTATDEQKAVVKAAVEGSGGTMIRDWAGFGFTAFVPEPVAKLVEHHGESFGLKVWENACMEIPWCGEAPC